MHKESRLSIWFFVGVMLTLYGIIILIPSIQSLLSPTEETKAVLANLHPGVWWGAVLLAGGLVFLIIHWPWKKSPPPGE